MDDKQLKACFSEITNEISELKKELRRVADSAERDLVGSTKNLGATVKQRFEALEAVVLILLREQGKGVRKEVREEIEERKATWLQD